MHTGRGLERSEEHTSELQSPTKAALSAAATATLLGEQIEGTAPPHAITVPCRLVVRASTRRHLLAWELLTAVHAVRLRRLQKRTHRKARPAERRRGLPP